MVRPLQDGVAAGQRRFGAAGLAAKAGGLDLSGLGNLTGKPTGKITVESNSPTQEQKLQDIVDKLTTLVAVTQAKMDRDDRYANRNLERI